MLELEQDRLIAGQHIGRGADPSSDQHRDRGAAPRSADLRSSSGDRSAAPVRGRASLKHRRRLAVDGVYGECQSADAPAGSRTEASRLLGTWPRLPHRWRRLEDGWPPSSPRKSPNSPSQPDDHGDPFAAEWVSTTVRRQRRFGCGRGRCQRTNPGSRLCCAEARTDFPFSHLLDRPYASRSEHA